MGSNQRIPQIDCLRGAAALYVVLFHVHSLYGTSFKFVDALFSRGGLAVDVFFCASGFLVFASLKRRIQVEARPFLNFVIRRVFRIIPLWWTVLILEFGLGCFNEKILLANMFFYFGFLFYDLNYLPISVAWSLFVEETFYVMMPLLFKALKKPRRVTWLFTLSYVFSLVWTHWAHDAGVPSDGNFITWSPLANFQFFFLGILIHHFVSETRLFEKFREISASTSLSWLDLLVVAGFLSNSYSFNIPDEITAAAFFLAAIVPTTALSRILNNSFLKWAGVRCYGIYLIHRVVLDTYLTPNVRNNLFAGLHVQNQGLVAFITMSVTATGTTLIFAGFSHLFLETPCCRWGEILISKFQKKKTLPVYQKAV